ncbi:MAG: cation-transporting P-type ATPase [Candidatus Thiodiazotropha sp. (ex. Lucinisca nassula)]|nr:cation-transporting P-type ATPase [Candidatus Thiodiazotropha sp. (ex. Lucinisca nassula)]MBW9274121.1 cation-transporting P-type ATPase [Candidatus Thiodiazotropha sp. (ex. Lucinisca nassula)]PUB77145.1 MAG: carbonate dehydratase [gamma proteobacterium symbiont of Ctena orbiculata]PUB83694.1 MAG: carbonate dehydratase [gamma proteobacterium symbiont of Ctena orbiculata]
MDTLLSKHWHHLSADEVEGLLETSATKGLDIFELEHRHAHFGPNRLTPQKGKGPLELFILQFHQPLIYILLAAALITFLLQEWVDSGVIFGVVLVNAIVGFIQESKALKAIEALAQSMEGSATVVRAGKKTVVPSSDVVPGDLVLMQSGDKVPADLRLVHSRELQIDESTLTGESVPVQKRTEELAQETVLADRHNMAYSSTLVTHGTGAGLVVATGDSTEIGHINALISSAEILATPLTRKITQFSGVLLWIILVLAGLTILAGWMHGGSLLETFMAAVALAVGAIPEGLPAAMTIMLAIGVSKMARRNAIIRRMPAVETLGSTTVICSDKTGTLTQNQMTVKEVCAGGGCYEFAGTGYAPEGNISLSDSVIDVKAHGVLIECLRAGLLCNESRLIHNENKWGIEGDPTEAALVSAALKAGLTVDSSEQEYPRIDTLPFESEHHYMATLHQTAAEAHGIIYMKGSVESIVSRCQDALDSNGDRTQLDTDLIDQQVEEMATRGLRVLSFARKIPSAPTSSVGHADVSEGLTFLGLQAMMDPPRQEAISSVNTCQQAGVRVKMITGDHVVTAASIAHQIGLDGTTKDNMDDFAISGHALTELTDQNLVDAAGKIAVFARVTPEQKLRLVEALQAQGHVVAMTGDGVNDAPALKQADIGVAMGMGGTEVAKEAADMVLTDDNFSTIEAAVEEGRAVFDNLVKFITWTLPTNVGEGLVILLAVFLGVALPITPVQILWINMTTAVLLGLMLAFEDKEPGIMTRPPRRPETPVITQELAIRIGVVSLMLVAGAFGLFEWVLSQGQSLEIARTVAMNMFVFGELFYLFNCRSLRYSMFQLGVFSNRWLILGVTVMAGLQILMTYVPTMNLLFGTAPIGLVEWGLILGGGLAIYTVVGTEKWMRRLKHNE